MGNGSWVIDIFIFYITKGSRAELQTRLEKAHVVE